MILSWSELTLALADRWKVVYHGSQIQWLKPHSIGNWIVQSPTPFWVRYAHEGD